MPHKSYREKSKLDWGTQNDSMSFEQIQLGAILRIADATEIVAKSYNDLIQEKDRLKRQIFDMMERSREDWKRITAQPKDNP